jgi:hypothetical protein
MVWFQAFMRSPTRQLKFLTSHNLTLSGKGDRRQLHVDSCQLLSPPVTEDAFALFEPQILAVPPPAPAGPAQAPDVPDQAQPQLLPPAIQAQAPGAPAHHEPDMESDGDVAEDSDSDEEEVQQAVPVAGGGGLAAHHAGELGDVGKLPSFGQRRPWSLIGTHHKNELMVSLQPILSEAVKRTIHPNRHGDVSEILVYAGTHASAGPKQHTDRAQARKKLAETSAIKALAKSYVEARPKTAESMRILSTFSREFSLHQLNNWVLEVARGGCKVSAFVKRQADEHADAYGAGRDGPKPKKMIRNRLDEDDLSYCFSIILPYVNSHAYGTRSIALDQEGASVELPQTTADIGMEELKNIYKDEVNKNPQFSVIADTQVISSLLL